MRYDVRNWYWQVTGNSKQVYSSAAGDYVSVNDAKYKAWLNDGGVPTKISADDMILRQIEALEATITPRLVREAITASAAVFASGPFKGKTAAQAITSIEAEITELRDELS